MDWSYSKKLPSPQYLLKDRLQVKGIGRTQLLYDMRNRRYWEMKTDKGENNSLLHEHKKEVPVIFGKFKDMPISSILNDNKT